MENSGKPRNWEHIARDVATSALKSLDAALATGFSTRPPGDVPQPVFIVGVPRSGTTVVYQAMTAAWHFAYINNVTARFPRSVARVSRLLGAHRWAVPGEFENFVGGTPGSTGPNEAVAMWAHAFPSDTHEAVQPEEVDPDRERWLVASVACLTDQFRAPFISKTPCNSLRISALASIFPKSLFVVVKRDLLEVAQSLLAARRERCGNERGHYSVIPRGLEKRDDLPPVEYVAEQVSLTEIAIREAQSEISGNRFHEIDYLDFCADPRGVLGGIEEFCSDHGLELERRPALDRMPKSFSVSRGIHMPASERLTIEKALLRYGVV